MLAVKSSKWYDEKFTKKLREVRPDWNYESEHLPSKDELLEAIRSGKLFSDKEPSCAGGRTGSRDPIATKVLGLTRARSREYSYEFTEELRIIHPEWDLWKRRKDTYENCRRGRRKK